VSGGDSDSEKPLSAFYQSLLESSYAANGNLPTSLDQQQKIKSYFAGFKQLSEKEMMQKALMQSIQDISKSRRNKNNTDDEYDSP
jgi:hypothetical protein